VAQGKQVKPGIDMKSGLSPTRPWACAPEWRDDLRRVGPPAFASPERAGRSRSKAQRYGAIRVTRRFSARSDHVFNAWLDPGIAGRWLFATASRPMAHVEIDARVEGSFCFVDRRDSEITEYTGEYIEIVPERRLVFTLSLEENPHVVTRVTVEIAPLTKGCELTLTHENLPQDRASHIEGRWTGILYGLGVTLDSASRRSTTVRSNP
jgi:uncharacterized protein YndB with AHSA1/START domain